MKLRRIEIIGFKSFRSKTGIDMADGVTAVVGPNGCGKSNVVDAMRWAMGSQSPKDLRGHQMQDVIFAGSDKQRPLGMCEVGLVFENREGSAPGIWREKPEIAVRRRLFRTGESEYEINGTQVRLRDIQELFMGTGVGGRDAYSIIEQGRIDFVVSARPEERRLIIEEAAGVTRYRFQRKSAERRLEKTRENLLRVGDIVTEVARQLASLERQAKRAQKWQELSTKHRRLELLAALHRYDVAAESLGAAQAAAEGARARHADSAAALDAADAATATDRATVFLRERELLESSERVSRLRARSDLLRNNVSHQERESGEVSERLNAIEAELAEQNTVAARAGAEIEMAAGIAAKLAADVADADVVVRARSSELAQAAEQQQALSRQLATASQSLTRLRGARAEAEGRLAAIAAERGQLDARRVQLAGEAAQAEAAIEEARAAVERERARSESSAGAAAALVRALDQARDAERAAHLSLSEAQRRARSQAESVRSAEARVETLEALLRAGDSLAAGARKALAARKAGKISPELFPLAARLRVDAVVEAAVLACLGDRLDALLVARETDAALVVRWARQEQAPLSVMALVQPVEGKLIDGVVATAPVPGEIASLLRGHRVVDDVTTDGGTDPAVDSSRSARSSPGSFVVRTASPVSAVLRMGRELDAAQAGLAQARDEAKAGRDLVERAEAALETALSARTDSQEQATAAQHEAGLARGAATEAERELGRVEAASLRAAHSLRALLERDALLSRSSEESRAALATMAEELQRTEDTAAALQAELGAVAAVVTERQELLASARVFVAQQSERLRAAETARARAASDAARAADRTAALARESSTLQTRLSELRASTGGDRTALQAAADDLRAAERSQSEISSAHDHAMERLREREATTILARRNEEAARDERQKCELQAERARAEHEHAGEAIAERFRLSPAAARRETGDARWSDEDRLELEKLAEAIERLGAVNPGAVEAFAEAEQRHDFLKRQMEDLQAAVADLESAIRKMDKTSRELFETTFAQLNSHFQSLFPRLFRGGKARLELVDPEDPLESGVEIVAQPPGKRLQSMTLLSGGEKALTAVALVFAIFQLKPTPFCVLDEVDAPLDEANVGRFNELVREMASGSQFLLITHNKRTMATADTLYGVTMEEPGVSKVVGVRMHGPESSLDLGS